MLPQISIGPIFLPTHPLIWILIFIITTNRLGMKFVEIKIDETHVFWLILLIMIFGAFGAKLFDMIKYVIVHPQVAFVEAYSQSGLGSYGLLIFGVGSAAITMRLVHLPVLKILDILAPSIIFATAMGRLGCFLAGDGCYGPPTDLPWGMSFPHGIIPTLQKVHPTPLYEIIALIPAYIIIRKISKTGFYPDGFIFTLSLFLTSAVRIVMEFWRSNVYSPRIIGMTVEQVFAIGFTLVTGYFLLGYFPKGSKEKLIMTK